MIKSIYTRMQSNSAYSLFGQASFLIANFALFLILIKSVDTASFGNWALYITIISITDGLRQGLLQNGLTRAIIKRPAEQGTLIASGLLINYVFIAIISLAIWAGTDFLNTNTELTSLLAHSAKSLLGIGTLQFLNILYFSNNRFKRYFISNLLYLSVFLTGLILLQLTDQLTFITAINLQCLSVAPSVIYYLFSNPINRSFPSFKEVKRLLNFGKYIAGTNLLSMLFHKADILMLAFFTDPVAVAMFHFATKIVGYAELPLNALSQVIYPKLAASYHQDGVSQLKQTYVSSIVNLLLMAIPVITGVIMFRNTIISILSTDTYHSVSPLIVILCLAGIFKPFGRVFGLTLDAIGKPQVNLQMLSLSLIVNVVMNLILIPAYGVLGAAIATCSSIIITVVWGQIRIRKYMDLNHLEIARGLIKSTFKYRNLNLKTS